MSKLSDEQLLEELKQRIAEKNRLLDEQKQFMADLKTVNDKLLQAEKLKTQFLSNIKNEINNPMTSIMGLLKVNMAKSTSPESAIRNTRLVYKETSVLNFQLQNIFLAAELEAGDIHLQLAKFSCKQVVEDAMSVIQNQSTEGVQCTIAIDEHEMILSDRHKVFIIFSNLLSNAKKFGKDDQNQIEVKLTNKADGQLIFSVSDQGVGISDQDKANIYDRFNQLEIGTTKNYGGHGLGLSIIHELIDLLDGTLKIETEVGKGTTVLVTLPAELQSSDEVMFSDEGFELFAEEGGDEEIF